MFVVVAGVVIAGMITACLRPRKELVAVAPSSTTALRPGSRPASRRTPTVGLLACRA
jgi:hypothetical protein